MDRTERRSRSPDDRRRRRSSREYNNGNGGGGHTSSYRRRSRSWSRSRSRDRDRRSSRRHHHQHQHHHHHNQSRSRSRDRSSSNVYHRGGSPDQYHDMLNDDDGEYHSGGGNDRYYDRDHRNHHHADRRRGNSSSGGGGGHHQHHHHRSGDSSEHRQQRHRSDYEQRHHGDRRRRDRSDDSFLDEMQSNYSFDGDQSNSDHYRNQTPSDKIIIMGLAHHITESDISNDLIHYGLQATSIRLIRKRKSGASRGFAFVEFDTQEEATRWMEYKQGVLMVNDEFRAVMQYSRMRDDPSRERVAHDWFCVKCGVFNFKRRDSCYKCAASREESLKGGEGSDEVSTVLTKKILLRNLDVLTNEEGVLTHMQRVVPTLVAQIAEIQICRDPLTSTSRGVCYLTFATLVDAMNTHNALKALDPPLSMEGRDVIITYCVESPDASKASGAPQTGADKRSADASKYHRSGSGPSGGGGSSASDYGASKSAHHHPHRYQLSDVPRLAEYSAGVYASTPVEHEHYRKYYTDYYVAEIEAGNFASMPTIAQIEAAELAASRAAAAEAVAQANKVAAESAAAARLMGANSGAAVALSAIQRKQQIGRKGGGGGGGGTAAAAEASSGSKASVGGLQVPSGRDNKKYATPDVSQYQYDEQSTYYYDPLTGLYYDANSQYYYNGDTGEYLYWNAEHSTYTVAPSTGTEADASAASDAAATASEPPATDKHPNGDSNGQPAALLIATADEAIAVAEETPSRTSRTTPGVGPGDKVKVAKKIVKDMERWAKQLNQKKDQMYQLQPLGANAGVEPLAVGPPQIGSSPFGTSVRSADVGFAILENKERAMNPAATAALLAGAKSSSAAAAAALPALATYESDSDNEQQTADGGGGGADGDHVAYDRLTCLLCKRAFPSGEVLAKHVQMSALHKENLRKLQQQGRGNGATSSSSAAAASSGAAEDDPSSLSYRDRAKERRQKYGEPEPPPVARNQWEKAAGSAAQLKHQQQQLQLQQQQQQQQQAGKKVAAQPIGQNNVGNRLLQKMGWHEGQGLGRANQGRTNIIEAESRAPAAGLGTKSTAFVPGDDYKTYIKRMMKARYEQAED